MKNTNELIKTYILKATPTALFLNNFGIEIIVILLLKKSINLLIVLKTTLTSCESDCFEL